MFAVAVFALCEILAGPPKFDPKPYTIDQQRSVIAFITYRAGFLSGLTENLVTVATSYESDMHVGAELTQARFSIRIDANSLTVNDPKVLMKWDRTIQNRDLLDKPPDEMRESKRRRIRRTILSDKVMDAERYPNIYAKMTSAEPIESPGTDDTHRIHLDVTIHDTTVGVDWPARIEQTHTGITIDSTGKLKFSDFGIDPYSSVLGAVKYKDEFSIFAHLEAHPAHAPQP